LLGAAAGGGLPQWNCGCQNCHDARIGRIPRLTQSSVAIRDDAGCWFIINASPDLPVQILNCSDLWPKSNSLRGSSISGVLLTNADLDHVLGLLSLREGTKLHIYATKTVRETLEQGLNLTSIMEAFCGVSWHEISSSDPIPLIQTNGMESSLSVRVIHLPGEKPLFAGNISASSGHSVAYYIEDRQTRGRLLVAPDVARSNQLLNQAMMESDAVIFDGTFWSEDELQRVKPGARTAAEMGHMTIKDSSMALLGSLPARHKIYIHINNTNPILSPDSTARAAVQAANLQVGYDGLEFDL
jgi:pyrroloquinoline quinone biosynthesis protein B